VSSLFYSTPNPKRRDSGPNYSSLAVSSTTDQSEYSDNHTLLNNNSNNTIDYDNDDEDDVESDEYDDDNLLGQPRGRTRRQIPSLENLQEL
jgi:hypothetical protein